MVTWKGNLFKGMCAMCGIDLSAVSQMYTEGMLSHARSVCQALR